MNSLRDSFVTRCAGVLAASTLALAALWSATIPSPEWPLGGDPSLVDPVALDPVALDPTVLLAHGARIVATVMLGYLAAAAALNLIVGLLGARVRLPRPLTGAAARAPRWLRAASTGLVAGSALLAPGVAAAGPLPADPSDGAVTMEVVAPGAVEAGSSSDRAHRSVLPWTLPHAAVSVDAEPAAPRSSPTSTTEPGAAPLAADPDSVPMASAVPAPTSRPDPRTNPLPDPPRLEPLPADEPQQLVPPLTLERTPDGRVVEVPPATESAPAASTQHTVTPGEHFWAIAERVVAERHLDVPVADYWRLLVEANRSRLMDPSNPSLLFPGQVLVLP